MKAQIKEERGTEMKTALEILNEAILEENASFEKMFSPENMAAGREKMTKIWKARLANKREGK